MMSFNCGLALRRPGESTYAAVRRFAIANPMQNYSAIKKAATKGAGRCNGLLLARFAQECEIQRCQTYGIALALHAAMDGTVVSATRALSITRNCPQCAAMAYHSALYEIPWLSHCPLHGCELTTTCPACRQPWPSAGHLWRDDCEICSGHTSIRALVDAGAFNPTNDFSPIVRLQQALDTDRYWQHQSLIAFHTEQNEESIHWIRSPIPRHHSLFPSIAVAIQPESCRTAFPPNLSLQRCYRFHFDCMKMTDTSKAHKLHQDTAADIHYCRNYVKHKIGLAVVRSAGCPHPLRLLTTVRPYIGEVHCAYCAAYSIWRSLIELKPTTSYLSRYCLGSQLYADSNVPVIPRLWQAISPIPSYEKTDMYMLPVAAQRLLYAIDLWTTFVNIFKHVDFRYAKALQCLDVDYYRDEPNPQESISQALAFWVNDRGKLTVCVPSSVVRKNLPSRLADTWVSLCNTRR